MNQSYGGSIDIQKMLSKLPFSTTGIKGELHYVLNGTPQSYLGPGTSLRGNDGRPARCNTDCSEANLNPMSWTKEKTPADRLAHIHDHQYELADQLDPSSALAAKHAADRQMIEALQHIQSNTFSEKFMNWIVTKILQLKLKVGMGLLADEAKLVAREIHTPVRHNYPRRKVICNFIDEIHTGDLMDYSHAPISGKNNQKFRYILVNMDVFSKYAWVFFIPTKDTNNLINCYKQIFRQRKPKMLWWDQERGIFGDKFKKFLNDEDVKLYHTYSELKAVCAERLIRTLKLNCERIKTQHELENKKFSLYDVLPKVVKQYNNTIHSTIGMTPTQASKKENEKELQSRYTEDYYSYNPPSGKLFKVGDLVRLYKWKSTFEKGYTPTFTKEIFVVSKVNSTRPQTYQVSSLEGEPISGSVYSWELTKAGSSG
jgi:hypothetical protein